MKQLEFNVTLSSLFLSAISITSRCSSGNDFLMGLLLNGRPKTQSLQGMVGMFMNTLPYRTRIDETKLSSFIQSVHKDVEIIQNQYISINQIKVLSWEHKQN